MMTVVSSETGAQPLRYGYTGVQDPGALEELAAVGIELDLGSFIYSNVTYDTPAGFTADHLARFGEHGVQAGVSVAGFLFRKVRVTLSPCQDGSGGFAWMLMPDWEDRLLRWWKLHGSQLTPQNTAFVIVHEEVNNTCVDLGELEQLGHTLRAYLPSLPLAFGWSVTDVPGGPVAQPPPAHIPAVFDLLGIWSHGIYDPLTPDHRKNANGSFYDPVDPFDPGTCWGHLLSRKHPHQRVVLVFDAHYQEQANGTGAHQALGWSFEDLAGVAFNYWSFARQRPEIEALYGFHWTDAPGAFIGLGSLFAQSPNVLAAHQTVSCEILGACR